MSEERIITEEKTGPRAKKRVLIAGLLVGLLIAITVMFVYAGYPLVHGYADFSYIPDGVYNEGVDVAPEPTDKAVQSKLWWHDGSWWAVMFNPEVEEYHIYQLMIDTQEWVDTGVYVDHRLDSRSDVLWDADANKLYIATHLKQENPSNENNNPNNWGYLQQYHYNDANGEWVPDDNVIGDGTGVIANFVVEALVIEKDTEGRLWATYVVRQNDETDQAHYYVTVSASTLEDPAQWLPPMVLTSFPEAEVDLDDISGIISFADAGGPKLGLLWSNQRTGEFYFALHNDGDDVSDWTLDPEFEALKASRDPISADDHLNFAVTEDGDVLAIVKTSGELNEEEGDLIGVFARSNADGTWSWHSVSPSDSFDTRPIILVNETTDTAFAFTVSSTGGGLICYQDAPIPADLSTMTFPLGGCDPSDPFTGETDFIAHFDGGLENMSNPTSTKQRVTDTSGMVVLGSDDVNGFMYVHNMEGGDAPPQPPAATPPPSSPGLYLPIIRSAQN